MSKKISEAGIALLKKFEGCRLRAYQDAVGVYTIGFGHTKDVSAGQVITLEQAESYLRSDIKRFEENVNQYDSRYTWNQNEFDALVCFAFNTGSINGLVANGIRSRSVIAEKILLYNKGKVDGTYKEIAGLTTRRKAERELFLKGNSNTELTLVSTLGLSKEQIKANIIQVQKWLNEEYSDYIKTCNYTNYLLLKEDGIKGDKTIAALTIALQVYLNSIGCQLLVDGKYGTMTNKMVQKYVAVKEGTKSKAAKVVQGILYLNGYNPQAFCEEFTSDSANALAHCQLDNNLNPDKVAGVIFFSTFL